AGHVAERTGIRVALRARGAESRMRRELETLLYRFVQEALTNVVRHARAKTVRVDLVGQNGSMIAAVSDDGVGLAANGSSHKGFGLLGMRERLERTGDRLQMTCRRGDETRAEAA